MTTTFAVATPHALVLSVSHGLLFCQPPSFAAARMPQLPTKVSITTNTRCPRRAIAVLRRNPSLSISAQTTVLTQLPLRCGLQPRTHEITALALNSDLVAVEQPLHARGQLTPMRALRMKPLGLNLAIPSAVRSGFAIQLSAWPA